MSAQAMKLLETIQRQLAELREQAEAHHRETNGTLALLIEDKRQQAQRLMLLEARMGALEMAANSKAEE